jgi:hypothetical protein
LATALEQIMSFYEPDEINTQVPVNLSKKFPDHSDHLAVGNLTRSVYDQYRASGGREVPVKYYIGYPIHGFAPNVVGQDYQDKARIFFAYARFDGGACDSFIICNTRSTYGQYLKHQYIYDL